MRKGSIAGLLIAPQTKENVAVSHQVDDETLLCGKALKSHVSDMLEELPVSRVFSVGIDAGSRRSDAASSPSGDDRLMATVREMALSEDVDVVLIIPGDLPLLTAETVRSLVSFHEESGAAFSALSFLSSERNEQEHSLLRLDRAVRHERGALMALSATKEYAEEIEFVSSVYCVQREFLAPALQRVASEKCESLLRGIVGVLYRSGHRCETLQIPSFSELIPVQDHYGLALAEAEIRDRTNRKWLDRGVTIVDPQSTYIDATVQIGKDVTLLPGTILQGETSIGDSCQIGPGVRIQSCFVGEHTEIQYAVAQMCEIGSHCTVGPYVSFGAGENIADGQVCAPSAK